jgi:Sporulation and spore germination
MKNLRILLGVTILFFIAGCSTPVLNCPSGPRVPLNQAIPPPPPTPVAAPVLAPVATVEPKKVQTQKGRVYFARTVANATGCSPVRYLERNLESGEQFSESVLRELISGPSGEEKALGYSTAFPSETVLKSLTIKGEVVTVRFDSLKSVPKEGCARDILRRQIISTVMALKIKGVKIVRINTEDKSWSAEKISKDSDVEVQKIKNPTSATGTVGEQKAIADLNARIVVEKEVQKEQIKQLDSLKEKQPKLPN